MVHSMTSFARHQVDKDWGTLTIEIRSVNHRFLETHFRIPDTLKMLEIPLRDLLKKKLHRGKVELAIKYTPQNQNQGLAVDQALVEQLNKAISQISNSIDNISPVSPLDILQYPGVKIEKSVDQESINKAAMDIANHCIDDLIGHRQREGQELKLAIEQRLTGISAIVANVREKLPTIVNNQRTQILEKIAQWQVDIDSQRLEQEVAMLAQKIDVAEELDRLDAHVVETNHALNSKGSIGRRLDFLMQEFNREANTLSSKSVVTETTQNAVDLKVYIEQMREQVQNIE